MKGFTLIEILIYAALIAMMIGGALIAVFQLMESSEKIQSKIVAGEEANFLLRKITWALGGLDNISTPPAGTASSTLSVNKVNYSQNPIVFDFTAGNVRIKKGSGSTTVLNSQNITIQNLNFEHIAPGGSMPAAIKASIAINNLPFSTTIYLRK